MQHEIKFKPNHAGKTVLRVMVDAPNLFRAVRSVFRGGGRSAQIQNAHSVRVFSPAVELLGKIYAQTESNALRDGWRSTGN